MPTSASPPVSAAAADAGQLPAYLSAEAREALRQPPDNLPLAAVSAGQLLRAGSLRGPGRTHLQAWIAALSAGHIDLLGEVAAQELATAARQLHGFVSQSAVAQQLIRAPELVVDEEPAAGHNVTALPPAGWLAECVTRRDRAESLLVVLGLVALHGHQPSVPELAEEHERDLRAQAMSIDATARALGAMLGDEARGWRREAWLDHIAALEPEHWWTALAFLRSTARAPAASHAPQTFAPILELKLRPRTRPAPTVALAAHGQEEAPPVSADEGKETLVDTMLVRLTSLQEPDEEGDFVLNLWLTDESTLDLDGEAVRVLDEHGAPAQLLRRGVRPRRWWGYFRGEGQFWLHVAGLAKPLPLLVRRGE